MALTDICITEQDDNVDVEQDRGDIGTLEDINVSDENKSDATQVNFEIPQQQSAVSINIFQS